MKLSHYFIVLPLMLLLNGCKQQETEPAYYVYATVGSESFKFEGNTYLASSSGSYKSTFILAAYPDMAKELVFTTKTALTGQSGLLQITYASYSNGTGKYYAGGTGTCTINKFDGKVVEGTFEFDTYFYTNATTAPETLHVKAGRFRLKYT